MTYLECYDFWCNANLPNDVKAELYSIKNNDEE